MKNIVLLLVFILLGCTTVSNKSLNAVNTCYYADKADGELAARGECFEMNQGVPVRFKKEHLDRLAFTNGEPEQFYLNSVHTGYVNKEGKFIFTPKVDNGPDYFQDGLARYIDSGKMGFVNKKLEVVVPAQYEYVTVFSNGKAAYCSSCRHRKEGEYSIVESDSWSYINLKGEKL